MTNQAQLATQVANALTRWNEQLDQLAEWLAGDPSGGPNSDGRYPLTNASGETENFLCLPAVLDLVEGPAAQVTVIKSAVEALETAAAESSEDADTARQLSEAARVLSSTLRDEVQTLRDDVASKWAAVNAWASQVSNDAGSVTNALSDATTAKDEAVQARDAAEGYALSAAQYDPLDFASGKHTLSLENTELVRVAQDRGVSVTEEYPILVMANDLSDLVSFGQQGSVHRAGYVRFDGSNDHGLIGRGVGGRVIFNNLQASKTASNFGVGEISCRTQDGSVVNQENLLVVKNNTTPVLTLKTDGTLSVPKLRVRDTNAPSTATSPGEPGEVRWDSSYIYVCTASDTWRRSPLSSW